MIGSMKSQQLQSLHINQVFKRSAISVMVADFDFEHILPHYLAHDVDRF